MVELKGQVIVQYLQGLLSSAHTKPLFLQCVNTGLCSQECQGKQEMLEVSWIPVFTEEFITDGLQQVEVLLQSMKLWQFWLSGLNQPFDTQRMRKNSKLLPQLLSWACTWKVQDWRNNRGDFPHVPAA